MKSTVALALVLVACSSTTKGEGPSSSGSSSGTSSSGGATSSSGSTAGSTSSSGTTVSNAQCQTSCLTKVYSCNPDSPSSDATALCDQICSGSYSQSQLNCLQSTPCNQLASAYTLEDVCPP